MAIFSALGKGPAVHQQPAISPAELEAILKSHELFVAREHGGRPARLAKKNLANADLSHRDLADADFTGSTLYGAILKLGSFQRANFYCADLRNVDARFGNFTDADMRGAGLMNANFSSAKLDHADFRGGRLGLAGKFGIETFIERGGATGADFSYCSLRGASLENANLGGANFSCAFIQGTSFKGARLANAKFEGAILIDVNVEELRLPPDVLKSCVLSSGEEAYARLPHLLARLNAHQRWIESHAKMGASAVIDGEDLRPLGEELGKFKLTAISARSTVAIGMNFSCLELQGADFSGADLRGANFEGADLRGVNLAGAKLLHAKFTAANMTSLTMRSGTRRCDLSGADYLPEQLTDAVID